MSKDPTLITKETLLSIDADGRVYRYHHQPQTLGEAERRDGAYIDVKLIPPPPEVGRGESASLYFKGDAQLTERPDGTSAIAAKDLEWRVTARPWTQEELLEDIQERLARLEAALIPAAK